MGEEKIRYFDKAMEWLSGKSYTDFKSVHDDYQDPKRFTNQRSGNKIQPDFSFKMHNGANYYMEIAIKKSDYQVLVSKWKFLSMMASLKRGKLFLLAPKGHKMFTQKLVTDYNINAIVYSL